MKLFLDLLSTINKFVDVTVGVSNIFDAAFKQQIDRPSSFKLTIMVLQRHKVIEIDLVVKCHSNQLVDV